MKDPAALVTRIELALEGTTPGPWRVIYTDGDKTYPWPTGVEAAPPADDPNRTSVVFHTCYDRFEFGRDMELIAQVPDLLRDCLTALTREAQPSADDGLAAEWKETTRLLDVERRRWYAALEAAGLQRLEGLAPEVAADQVAALRAELAQARAAILDPGGWDEQCRKLREELERIGRAIEPLGHHPEQDRSLLVEHVEETATNVIELREELARVNRGRETLIEEVDRLMGEAEARNEELTRVRAERARLDAEYTADVVQLVRESSAREARAVKAEATVTALREALRAILAGLATQRAYPSLQQVANAALALAEPTPEQGGTRPPSEG